MFCIRILGSIYMGIIINKYVWKLSNHFGKRITAMVDYFFAVSEQTNNMNFEINLLYRKKTLPESSERN